MNLFELAKKTIEKLRLMEVAIKVRTLVSGIFFSLTKKKLFEVDQLNYWSSRAKKDTKEDDEYYKKFNNEIVDKLRSLEDVKSMLEIGSYLGERTELLSDNFPDIKIIASDIGTEQMKKCAMRFDGRKNISFTVCSATHLPFKDDSFDMVFSTTCLQHIPYSNIQRAIDEIERVAKNHILFVEAYLKHIPQNKKIQYLGISYYYMHDYENLLDNRKLKKGEIRGISDNNNYTRYTLFHYTKA